MMTYRRKNAQWDTTTNPAIAYQWLLDGEEVEAVETPTGRHLTTWPKG